MLLSTHFADQDAHRPLPGPPTGWHRRRREHLYSRPIGVKQNDPKNAFHTRQTRLKLVGFFFPNNTLSECLLSVCLSPEPRLLTFSDQKILGRIPRYSLELRCYSVMNEITATSGHQSRITAVKGKAHRICSGVEGGVHRRRGSVGSRAHRASGAR